MTIRIISDREVTLQMQIDVQGKALQKSMNEAIALKAERDEYQQAADKMAMEHKVERDTLRHQLSEAQALIEASRKQDAVAWQYQSRTGLWTPFLSEQHKNEMMIFSPGPIRALFAAPVVADDLLKDAALGKTAMRFVDRAGDVHPGIDDAETICADFYKAMVATLDAAIGGAA